MYARTITFHYQSGKMDEALHLLREKVGPEIQQQPGFQGVTNLVDRDNNKAISITLWDTNSALQSSGMGKLQTRFALINTLLAAPPIVEIYEITDDQRYQ